MWILYFLIFSALYLAIGSFLSAFMFGHWVDRMRRPGNDDEATTMGIGLFVLSVFWPVVCLYMGTIRLVAAMEKMISRIRKP